MSKPNNPPGTRVALYSRRSTDAHQEESLETQRRGAVDYCTARGWEVVEEFIDDAVSRAEFKKRPGLIRLLNHAPRKNFELVVMRDESRLGGDISRTGLVIQDLVDAGVGIVYYYLDERVSLEGAVDKFLVSARNFSSELEREKISERTHEHLLQKAKAGKPAGGISYGYAIVDKQYVVKETEAEVVRRIFSDYASGVGLRSIAHQLNDEAVPSPRAGKRGTGSWAQGSIRVILRNPRYKGEARYNQLRKVYKGGTKVTERRPVSEHVTYACPAIVSSALWDKVAERFAGNPVWGMKPGVVGARPRYLLTGISSCAQCGGPMTVAVRSTSKTRSHVYQCGWRKNRGLAICRNKLEESVPEVDARVIAGVRQKITPDIIVDVIAEVRRILAEEDAELPTTGERLRAEVEKLQREVARLTTAIAMSDDPPGPLLEALAQRDKRLRQAKADLARSSVPTQSLGETLDSLEFETRQRLRDLELSFSQLGEHARATLKLLTDGERVRFIPRNGIYRVEGSLAVPSLFPLGTAAADCIVTPTGNNTVGSALAAATAFRLQFVA